MAKSVGHFAPGIGDAHSLLGGSCHEAQFRPLAPLLGVLDVDSSVCHESDFLGNAGLGLGNGQ
jgi:hypothetical protein